MKTETISTICRMCDHGCGLEITVEDGQPVSLRGSKKHPFNKGWLCVKGRAALDFLHSPQRLSSPLIRRNGKPVPVEWEEALAYAAEKLGWVKDQFGPQSLAIYHGEGVGHQEIKYYMKRFANVYGTPNFMGIGSLCNASRTLAEVLTFGGLTKPDIPNTRFLIIWGGNPLVSHEPVPPKELIRLKRGGQIAVIDPRKTETALRADYHLAVKPGRDEILILNMLHVIFREELWDREFTDRWVHGFHRFFQTVQQDRFSPENGQELTGIQPDLVRQVAHSYAQTKPASIFTGNGLEHHSFGVSTMRLVAILKAITGNLDVPGGDLFTPRPRLQDMTMPLPEPSVPPLGSEKFPLFCQLRREAHAMCLPEAILEERPYPVKGMIIAGGNPSLEWPNSSVIRKALKKLEFLMVIDVVWSPDCQYASVILPACTFLERDEHRVNSYQNLPCITLRQKVMDPIHGLPDQLIWIKLAKQMGFADYFPWKNLREGINDLLSPLNLSFQSLSDHGGIYEYEKRRYEKYEYQEFNTPTGKVEIESERLKSLGYDPFPIRDNVLHHVKNLDRRWSGRPFSAASERETSFATPEEDSYTVKFPLFLTTGGNLLCYLHWQYRYIPKLRKISPEPIFEVHPRTALRYGIAEGETAKVQTTHGKIRLKAHLTSRIRPDTIHIPQGWEEANVNELTGMEDADPLSGFPNLKSLRCRIQKT